MSYKIIIDSCGELLERWKTDENIERAPLTLTVDGEDIVDDETFDQAYFLRKVADSPNCPKSSCPSPACAGMVRGAKSKHSGSASVCENNCS